MIDLSKKIGKQVEYMRCNLRDFLQVVVSKSCSTEREYTGEHRLI
jgi:hypothetical protein